VPDLSQRRWWVILSAMIVGLAGIGMVLNVALRGDPRPGPGNGAAIPNRTVVAFGRVDVEEGVCRMYATVPAGVVSQVPVKQGETVPAGAVLVRLDDSLARKKVDEAKAALEEANLALDNGRTLPEQHRLKLKQFQNAVEAAASQKEAARLNFESKQKLLQQNVAGGIDTIKVAQEELRQAENLLRIKQDDLNQLKLLDPNAQLRLLEVQVTRAEAVLAQAREALKQYTLVAPAAGTVMQITVRVGDTVGGAAPVPAIQFCPAGPRIIKAEVDQASAALVKVGQKVTVEDDSHAPGQWTGKVKWVADWFTNPRPVIVPDPNQPADARMMECWIELDRGQPTLKINQRVLATIDIPSK
jgi:multidrug resistance efflux pump